MAFTPNSQLKPDTQIILRDQQHAARLFVDDQFKFLPKDKFLFHVSFSINQNALTDKSLIQKYRNEINMLVKSIDLPGYTVQNEVLNQYNRIKVVQYRHKLNDIAIKFHDDNSSVINKLWQNYYKYYYADTTTADTGRGFEKTATKNFSFIKGTYGYKGNVLPFFNHITIYQLARHEFVGYKLINPVVLSWAHNKMDYSSKESNDFDMKLAYEAVSYSQGTVETGTPAGFGVDRYDQKPSPLASAGTAPTTYIPPTGTSSNILTQQINNYQNVRPSDTTLSNLLSTATPSVSGIQGVSFPGTVPSGSITTASAIKLS